MKQLLLSICYCLSAEKQNEKWDDRLLLFTKQPNTGYYYWQQQQQEHQSLNHTPVIHFIALVLYYLFIKKMSFIESFRRAIGLK